jgi:hypothetical protein
MPTTDTNHVDLAEVRDRNRAYARAIANLMRANEPQSTLTQAGRAELYATAMEAACESAKDVPGLADQVQQLRDELKRYRDMAAEELRETHHNPAYLADNLAATKVERDEFAADVERLREELDAIGDMAYGCPPHSALADLTLTKIHARAKRAAKDVP